MFQLTARRCAAAALAAALAFTVAGSASGTGAGAKAAQTMKVTSSAITGGKLADRYGAKGPGSGGVPTVSLPLKVSKAPRGTKYLAVLVTDPDAKPIAGRVFRHWMAVNIKGKSIPANASAARSGKMSQGLNDYGTLGYGGPNPPNGPHTYVITVYALKGKVKLSNGFDLSIAKFKKKLKSKTLATATIRARYPG
jgi:Raf kinase inhibitor-like YbhB/YbcL family protein